MLSTSGLTGVILLHLDNACEIPVSFLKKANIWALIRILMYVSFCALLILLNVVTWAWPYILQHSLIADFFFLFIVIWIRIDQPRLGLTSLLSHFLLDRLVLDARPPESRKGKGRHFPSVRGWAEYKTRKICWIMLHRILIHINNTSTGIVVSTRAILSFLLWIRLSVKLCQGLGESNRLFWD